MRDIPLTTEPNQEFTVSLDGLRYTLRFKEANGVMAVDVKVNDLVLLTGGRVAAGAFLIPYPYLQGDGGNFLLLTDDEALPYWREFNVTQSLVYISAAELAAL
mgnify:CR=1 FL=1